MRKIDLNMTVKDWCEQAMREYRMSVRLVNCLLHKGIEDITMRSLCSMTVAQVSDLHYFGQRTMTELVHILARHGLSLEMTGADIKEYEDCVESKPDTIDWEKRKWEAALRFATAIRFDSDGNFAFCNIEYSVEKARDLVDAYKKSLRGNEGRDD